MIEGIAAKIYSGTVWYYCPGTFKGLLRMSASIS
jgi:hypothetical protein